MVAAGSRGDSHHYLNGIVWPRGLSAMSYLWITTQRYHFLTTHGGGSTQHCRENSKRTGSL
jgi:hypothetical protein